MLWTENAAKAALDPIKELVDAGSGSKSIVTDMRPKVQGCVAPGCCCQFPTSISVMVNTSSNVQAHDIDQWVQSIRNGTGTLFPKASCILDSSQAYAQENPQCIGDASLYSGWPVVCRELLACGDGGNAQGSIDAVKASMQPWFQQWNYTAQDEDRFFFPTFINTSTALTPTATASLSPGQCLCSFRISIALQLPVNPEYQEIVMVSLDDKLGKALQAVESPAACQSKNNTIEYAASHLGKCSLPATKDLALPRPDDPTAPFCKKYLVCVDDITWDSAAAILRNALEPVFEEAGITINATLLQFQALSRSSVKYGDITCTCSVAGEVLVTISDVTYAQMWLLHDGLNVVMLQRQGLVDSVQCVLDAYREYVAATPVCRRRPTPGFPSRGMPAMAQLDPASNPANKTDTPGPPPPSPGPDLSMPPATGIIPSPASTTPEPMLPSPRVGPAFELEQSPQPTPSQAAPPTSQPTDIAPIPATSPAPQPDSAQPEGTPASPVPTELIRSPNPSEAPGTSPPAPGPVEPGRGPGLQPAVEPETKPTAASTAPQFDCPLIVYICDNSIDYAWTDAKLRLTADDCFAQNAITDITYSSGELSFYRNCRCNFPGYLRLLFPAGKYTALGMDSVVSCVVQTLQLKYPDSVCVEGEQASKCLDWAAHSSKTGSG